MSFTTSQNETSLDLLNEHEVAPVVKKSVSWLRRARVSGTGPCYRKIGGHVFYDRADVLSWLQSHTTQTSTKEKNL